MTQQVLICPSCKEKLFILREEPVIGVTNLYASLFKPYSESIPQPIDNEPFACPLCKGDLYFNPNFIIEEEIKK